MVEVVIDSIRVSLMSQHRVVVLKDAANDRYLTIFIGPCEADAITIHLQSLQGGSKLSRPMTHDLLKSVLETLGGKLQYIVINDLSEEVYYAELIVDVDGTEITIDSRPSDAIALAVRAEVPVYVADDVMERASSTPDEEIIEEADDDLPDDESQTDDAADLDIFADFLNNLDMDDLDE